MERRFNTSSGKVEKIGYHFLKKKKKSQRPAHENGATKMDFKVVPKRTNTCTTNSAVTLFVFLWTRVQDGRSVNIRVEPVLLVCRGRCCCWYKQRANWKRTARCSPTTPARHTDSQRDSPAFGCRLPESRPSSSYRILHVYIYIWKDVDIYNV